MAQEDFVTDLEEWMAQEDFVTEEWSRKHDSYIPTLKVKLFHSNGSAEQWAYSYKYDTWHKLGFRLSFSTRWFRVVSGYHQ